MEAEERRAFQCAAICWRLKPGIEIASSEIYSKVLASEQPAYLEELPVDEIAEAASAIYDRTDRTFRRENNVVSWMLDDSIHRIEITPKYFLYGSKYGPSNSQAGSFEIIDLPQIAGRFGCVFYSPLSDKTMKHPVGSRVTAPSVILRPHAVTNSSENTSNQCIQLPTGLFGASLPGQLPNAYASLDLSCAELEEKTRVVFEEDLDGLSDYQISFLQIGEHKFKLQQRFEPGQALTIYLGVDVDNAGEAIDLLLSSLGLTSANLTWTNDTLFFRKYELWRQDDNGNKFLVGVHRCRADAQAEADKFAAHGHKQFYWVRPAPQSLEKYS